MSKFDLDKSKLKPNPDSDLWMECTDPMYVAYLIAQVIMHDGTAEHPIIDSEMSEKEVAQTAETEITAEIQATEYEGVTEVNVIMTKWDGSWWVNTDLYQQFIDLKVRPIPATH